MDRRKSAFSAELSRLLVEARKARQSSPVGKINSLVNAGKELGLADTAVVVYVLKELRQ